MNLLHTLFVGIDNDFVPRVAGPNQFFVFGFTDEDLPASRSKSWPCPSRLRSRYSQVRSLGSGSGAAAEWSGGADLLKASLERIAARASRRSGAAGSALHPVKRSAASNEMA